MRYVEIRELQKLPAAEWKKVLMEENALAVTSDGKPIALLSALPDCSLNHYVSTVKRVRAQNSAAAMQQASMKAETDRMSLDDINAEISSARSERSRSSTACEGTEPSPETIRARFSHTDVWKLTNSDQ